jgi:hypothetical protein
MSNSRAFEWACSALEEHTTLNRLEARGTLRLTLREAGLDAHSVTPTQLAVALEKVLPGQLVARGVADAEALGQQLASGIASADLEVAAPSGHSPEEVFRRLAGA